MAAHIRSTAASLQLKAGLRLLNRRFIVWCQDGHATRQQGTVIAITQVGPEIVVIIVALLYAGIDVAVE